MKLKQSPLADLVPWGSNLGTPIAKISCFQLPQRDLTSRAPPFSAPPFIGTTWSGRHQSSRLAARQDGGLDKIWCCCSGIAGSKYFCASIWIYWYIWILGFRYQWISNSSNSSNSSSFSEFWPRLDHDWIGTMIPLDPLGLVTDSSGLAWLKLIQTTVSEAWVLHEHARYMRNQDIDISWYINISWYLKICWYWCRSDICRQFAIRSFAFTDIGYGSMPCLHIVGRWASIFLAIWMFPECSWESWSSHFLCEAPNLRASSQRCSIVGIAGFSTSEKNQNLRLIICSIIFSWKVVIIKLGCIP